MKPSISLPQAPPVSPFRKKMDCRVEPGNDASTVTSSSNHMLVIPGSPPSVAPRNDEAAHMIGFMESLY
jgi:hypothetical protein